MNYAFQDLEKLSNFWDGGLFKYCALYALLLFIEIIQKHLSSPKYALHIILTLQGSYHAVELDLKAVILLVV